MSTRLQALTKWYQSICHATTEPMLISGDASFRKFYRVPEGILMDAPPQTEKNQLFCELSALLNQAQIHAPKVYAHDFTNGFLLVEDLGDNTLAKVRTPTNKIALYQAAIDVLPQFAKVDATNLEPFDEAFITRENDICHQWCFQARYHYQFTAHQLQVLQDAEKILIANDLAQPQIAVHRDYHSRNIMMLQHDDQNEIAVVDFQDMVRGPLTYDLVSLLRDCYYQFTNDELEQLLQYAYPLYHTEIDYQLFRQYFDLTGLQRHYKCLGIFNRLSLRDGKHGYLKDLPLVKHYVLSVAQKYPQLHEFADLIAQVVVL